MKRNGSSGRTRIRLKALTNKLDDTGLAIEWLAKAMQAGYTPEHIRTLREFDNLANNPSYQRLIKSSHL